MTTANFAYDPDVDGICPPWWPFWWRRNPPKPKKFEALEQAYLALTIVEMAGRLEDAEVSKELQGLANTALRKQVEGLNL